MHESPNLEECFKRGVKARECGLRLADNPYDVRTPEHREWIAGWSATLDLDEDDDPESTRVKAGATDNGAEPEKTANSRRQSTVSGRRHLS